MTLKMNSLVMNRSDFDKIDNIIYRSCEDMFSGLFDYVYDALIADLEDNIDIIENDDKED